MKKCTNCGIGGLITSRRDENGVFCSKKCQSWFAYPGFCETCILTTTETSAGSTTRINGIGTKLFSTWGGRCSTCDSQLMEKWFTVLWIPIWPMGQYRVRYQTREYYVSRERKEGVLPEPAEGKLD